MSGRPLSSPASAGRVFATGAAAVAVARLWVRVENLEARLEAAEEERAAYKQAMETAFAALAAPLSSSGVAGEGQQQRRR